MIEEAIYSALKSDTAIEAKVKDGSVYHIYPNEFPAQFPTSAEYAILYHEIAQKEVPPLLKESTMQVSCFGKTFSKARELATLVETCLNRQSEVKLGGVLAVNYVQLRNRVPLKDQSSGLWFFALDFTIKF